MAVLFAQLERIDDAIDMQRRAIALAEATEHPDLPVMQEFLARLQEPKG
jgi:hypothetical protein